MTLAWQWLVRRPPLPEGSTPVEKHSLCPSASPPRRLHAHGRAFALPEGFPTRRLHAIGSSMALPLDRAHAVLQCAPPCAHPRHSNASHKAIAPHKRRAGEMARERQIAKHPAFHTLWLVKGSIEKLTFHKPMRQRAVCVQRSAIGDADALPWVRARGRARQNGLHTERLHAI